MIRAGLEVLQPGTRGTGGGDAAHAVKILWVGSWRNPGPNLPGPSGSDDPGWCGYAGSAGD